MNFWADPWVAHIRNWKECSVTYTKAGKGKDRKKNQKNKQKTHNQMTDLMISIMSLSVNGLNKLIKTDCMNGLKKQFN